VKVTSKTILSGLAVVALTLSSATAFAKKPNKGHLYNPNTPSLTVVNTMSNVSGYVADMTDTHFIYPISGEVYATVTDGKTGETLGAFKQLGSISATALFGLEFGGLMNPDWGSLPATLPWTMGDDFAMEVEGTTFSIAEELTGRAFPHLGPVENPLETGTMALRMSGCAGLRADDQGKYAGKVGTLCLNGTFTFDEQFNGDGVSNCSIAIHDPLM
jgi:hypothetical protein